ncbi:MAG: WD40 repeat domain-containing protein [Anaerolineae bacterium]|nr:WD40 repeat domain-containing protein [Anaerolineae bacterium]
MGSLETMALDQNDEKPIENPYIGPRTYKTEEAHLFFGRDREARDLISLIVSERLVLFYAQSGAGKSSLLKTKLIPGLAAEGFEVLPIGRVSGQSGFDLQTNNIFIYNVLQSLHQDQQVPDLKKITLPHFLDNLVHTNGKFLYDVQYQYADDEELKPRVLMIDQFEEILTTNIPFWQHRAGFFIQLSQAMEIDDQMWVVLTIREDFIAGLNPYLHYLPSSLRNRFYMRRLNREAALEAITLPAKMGGRSFAPEAAEILVDNLRQIRVQERENEIRLGEFVEPVQLQTVCFQMWAELKERPGTEITEQDIRELADVDKALILFYEDVITKTVAQTGVSEIDLRNWFQSNLITEVGTRDLVFRGDKDTGGLPNTVADFISSQFMLQAEMRSAGTWYELVHDRLVDPISQSNQRWAAVRMRTNPLMQPTRIWLESDRSGTHLLTGQTLQLAEQYAQKEHRDLTKEEQEFLTESLRQDEIREHEARVNAQRRRNTFIAIVILAVVMTILAVWGWNSTHIAKRNELLANKARATAEAETVRAEEALKKADEQEKLAASRSFAFKSINILDTEPESSLRLAVEAINTSHTVAAENALRRAVASPWRATLRGHTDFVEAVDFSPDGDKLATAGWDTTIRIWDLVRQVEIFAFKGHKGVVNSVKFSPSGDRIISASSDGTLRVWDLLNKVEIKSIDVHAGPVWSTAFNPDGTLAITGSEDGAMIWDIEEGTEKLRTPSTIGRVLSVKFNPDGNRFVTASQDGTVRVWDVASSEQIVSIGDRDYNVKTADFSPDGQKIVTASETQPVRIWNALDGTLYRELQGHVDIVWSATFSPDGKSIVTTSNNNIAQVFNVENGRQKIVLRGHSAAVRSAAYSPDSRRIATVSFDLTTNIWDGEGGQQILTIELSDPVEPAVFDPTGTLILAAVRDGTAKIFDATSGEILQVFRAHEEPVLSARFSPDGNRIVTTSEDWTAMIWDVRTNSKLLTYEGHSGIISRASFSPEGKKVVTASRDGTAQVWDTETGETLLVLDNHGTFVSTAEYSPDGTRIVTAGGDKTARVWDSENGQEELRLDGHTDFVQSAVFSPDGSKIITTGGDRIVRVWDADSGQPISILKGNSNYVSSAGFSPDENWIVTGSDDNTARVWDAASGEQILVLQGHSNYLSSATFSPDGRHILTASGDKSIRLWQWETLSELVNAAQARLSNH